MNYPFFLGSLIFMMIMFNLNSYFIINLSNYKMNVNKFKMKTLKGKHMTMWNYLIKYSWQIWSMNLFYSINNLIKLLLVIISFNNSELIPMWFNMMFKKFCMILRQEFSMSMNKKSISNMMNILSLMFSIMFMSILDSFHTFFRMVVIYYVYKSMLY